MVNEYKINHLLQSHREAVLVPEPLSGADGGVLGAWVHAPAHSEHAAVLPGVAAQQRVGQGALARPGGSNYDQVGGGVVSAEAQGGHKQ